MASVPKHKRELFRIAVTGALAAALVGTAYLGIRFARWRQTRRVDAEVVAIVAEATQAAISAENAPDEHNGHERVDGSVNRLLPDVQFTDIAGQTASLRDFRGSILVVSMTSIGCPISKRVTPALVRLAQAIQDPAVEFLLLNPDPDPSADDLKRHAEAIPGWRYVHDKDARFARRLGARTTTETFVIDQAQTLRYRGAVDDRFDVGVVRDAVGTEHLRTALAAVIDHAVVGMPVTPAPGCALGLELADTDRPPITWHNQIARFVQSNCVECHRVGQAAPFSLERYDQVLARKAMIEYVMEEHIMPPWFAMPSHVVWRNARVVSEADRQMFHAWVASGCAEGDPQDAPIPLQWAKNWSIGTPDIVIEVEPQEVPAEGFLPWRIFPLPFDVPEDLWVAAAEIRPSEPEVVHHAMLFVEYPDDDPRKSTQTKAESEVSGGADGFWLSYFPGRKAMNLPPGRGKLIPRNGILYLQLHYNANGQQLIDRPRIGFRILDAPPQVAVVSGAVRKSDFEIPPNSQAEFVRSRVFGEDVRLLALMPHMHSRGAAAQVFLKHADGRVEYLLDVPKYDFDWQIAYEFQEPLLVTKGSRIVIRHAYDNTTQNPDNPDPAKIVRHGNATSDEMMINFFDWEPAGDEPPPGTKDRPFI